MKSKTIIVLSALLVAGLAFYAIMMHRDSTIEEISPEYMLESIEDIAPELIGEEIGPEYTLEAEEDMAPDFSVQFLTGETFTLSEHRGTVVVLDFWTTWCRHCVAKMPTIQTLSERFEDDVIFVGMNVGEDPQRVQDFIYERGFTYPIGLDENGAIHQELFPSPGIPFMVIIDREGMITETFLGGGEGLEETYTNAILEALS